MKRFSVSCVLVLTIVAYSQISAAQCATDTDCKGERVCENGQCVMPPPPPAPAPAPAPAPVYTQPTPVYTQPAPAPAPVVPRGPIQSFQKGYGEISFLMGISSWGKATEAWEEDGEDQFEDVDPPVWKSTVKPTAGFRLAGYAVPSPKFHIGGYLALRVGEAKKLESDNDTAESGDVWGSKTDILSTSLGAAMKFGGQVGERVWVGGAIDIGINFLKIEEFEQNDEIFDQATLLGLELYPKICIDIIALDTGKFKLEIPISIGAIILPVAGRAIVEPDDDNNQTEVKVRIWNITPAITVGVAFGG